MRIADSSKNTIKVVKKQYAIVSLYLADSYIKPELAVLEDAKRETALQRLVIFFKDCLTKLNNVI